MKISPSWCVLNTLKTLKSLLQPNLVLIPSHVHIEANQVVNKLTNVGVLNGEEDICCVSSLQHAPPFLRQCIKLAQSDCHSSDGVPPSASCN
jgi:hypothetical protein